MEYGLYDCFYLHALNEFLCRKFFFVNAACIPVGYREIQIASVIRFVLVERSMKSGHPRTSLKTAAREELTNSGWFADSVALEIYVPASRNYSAAHHQVR